MITWHPSLREKRSILWSIHTPMRTAISVRNGKPLTPMLKQRKESCGSHYREDSPDTDDAHYLHRISIGLEEKIKKEAAASQFFTCEAAALSNIRASAL